jgi:hypothetical protein
VIALEKVTFAATQTMSMPLGQIAPPSAVTALGLKITCIRDASKQRYTLPA